MTLAVVHLFTLAEAHQHKANDKLPLSLRMTIGNAVAAVTGSFMRCIVCDAAMGNAVAYVGLLLPSDASWVPQYGGVCVECGTSKERDQIQRFVSHNAHLSFGDIAGNA